MYETYDDAKNWQFKANLPTVQFYDVAVDNATSLLYTSVVARRNNFSWCGPERTRNVNGIMNSDWFVTTGGDGFRSQVDPVDPNTIYSDRSTGCWFATTSLPAGNGVEALEGKGEAALRWNWDSPLIISPHSHTRLYFAANKLFAAMTGVTRGRRSAAT